MPLSEHDIVGPYGQIGVPIPEGEYFLLLRFEDTPVRMLGRMVSALSAAALLLAWVVRGRWRR